jgi:O-antigen/teichoic acid export membrane protein
LFLPLRGYALAGRKKKLYMNRKETIIKDTTKYSFAQYTSQGIGFIIAIAMRRFIGPYYMGIWSLLKVVQSYLGYLTLGVNMGAIYKIPFYVGKKDKAAGEETMDSTFSFMFLVSLFSCAALVVSAVVLRNVYPKEVIIGLLALAIYVVLQRFYSFYVIVLRAKGNFSVLSKSLLFDATANLFLVFLLVRQYKIYGLYIAISLLAVINTLFVHKLAKYKIDFRFNLKRVKSLIIYGFPILLNAFLGTILRTVDKIMIVKMLGVIYVGYYSIALMAKSYVYGLSNNLYIVTIPHMQETYGSKEDIEHIKKYVTIPAETISYMLSPLLGFIFLVTPLLIGKLLPQYVLGIVALQILLLDMFFQSCCSQAGQFLITLKKQAKIIPITVATITLNIILNYIFIKKGFGISGVALGTSLASFFSFVVLLVYAMKHFADGKDILIFILKLLLPLVYIASVVLSSSYFLRTRNIYMNFGISILILCIASFPLLFYINRKTHVLSIIFKMIFKR